MEPQIRTPRQHPLFDRHTVLGTIVLIILAYIVVTVPTTIVFLIVSILLPGFNINDSLFVGIAVMACIALLIYKLWFRPEFRGILFRGFTRTLKLCPVILPYWLLVCLPEFLDGNFPKTFSLYVFSTALTAGFSEEVIFRGFPLSYLKRQLRSEKQVPLIVTVTGVFFGLFHLTNIILGASLSASLVQAVSASCIGIFFGAVLMRGGNLLIPILLHSAHDVLMLSFQNADEVSAILTEEATPSDFLMTLPCIALAVFGFFLIRKAKRREICDMWAETWSQSTENQPEIPAEPENTTEV